MHSSLISNEESREKMAEAKTLFPPSWLQEPGKKAENKKSRHQKRCKPPSQQAKMVQPTLDEVQATCRKMHKQFNNGGF